VDIEVQFYRLVLSFHRQCPAKPDRAFKVNAEGLNRIRELLIADKFFLLDDDYGESAPGGHTKTVSVSLGKWKKTVRIHYRSSGSLSTNQKLSEPVRALHAYNVIHSWFQYKAPQAADTIETDNEAMEQLIKNSEEKK
jgi:hypothetical protein